MDNELDFSRDVRDIIDFDFYKVLFEPIRCELLQFISDHENEVNIQEIADNFTQDRSVISRHLELMNRNDILKKKKVGRNIYYSVNGKHVLQQFKATTANLEKLLSDCS